MENLFKSLENTKAETKTVIDDLVTGIETLLGIIFITLQDGKESNQEDLSGHEDSATLLLNKGKAKKSILQDYKAERFNKWMKTPIGIARVYKTFFIILLRLLGEDWE